MVSPFELVIKKWVEMGFFQFFFPFLLSSAIFYGLLRKSKIMGERAEVVNAVIALSISFMIWAYPIIVGIDITKALTAFFMQGFVIGLFALVGFMIASMFHPNIQEVFKEQYKWANLAIIGGFVLAGIIIVFTSGLWEVFGGPSLSSISPDVLESVMAIIVFLLMIGSMMFIVRGGGEKKE